MTRRAQSRWLALVMDATVLLLLVALGLSGSIIG